MNRLMIFDLDGVLFESRDMHFDTLNGALTNSGYDPISREEHDERYNGLPTTTKLGMLGITGQVAEEIKVEKQARTLGWVHRNVHKDEGLVKLFTDLHADGWQIAVASNAITVTVIRALQLLGLWSLCDFVTAGDRVEKPKPNPEMYLRCMQVCGAEPATTWIVEDSPVGVEAAIASGASVVHVSGPSDVDAAVRTIMEVVREDSYPDGG
jgi:beta-phosphoglucomutase